MLSSLSQCYNNGIEQLSRVHLVASYSICHCGNIHLDFYYSFLDFLLVCSASSSIQSSSKYWWQVCEGRPFFIANALCISTNTFNSLPLNQIHSEVLYIQRTRQCYFVLPGMVVPLFTRTHPLFQPSLHPAFFTSMHIAHVSSSEFNWMLKESVLI